MPIIQHQEQRAPLGASYVPPVVEKTTNTHDLMADYWLSVKAYNPMKAAKAFKCLETRIIYQGRMVTRGALMVEKVKAGWRMVLKRDELRIQCPVTEVFLDAREVTKTALDFACFLINRLEA